MGGGSVTAHNVPAVEGAQSFFADWESELVAEWRTGRRLMDKDGQDLGGKTETVIVTGRGKTGPGATGLCLSSVGRGTWLWAQGKALLVTGVSGKAVPSRPVAE